MRSNRSPPFLPSQQRNIQIITVFLFDKVMLAPVKDVEFL
jgi:hypothetical protein